MREQEQPQKQTPNIDTGSLDLYHNNKYGITIGYPSGWTLEVGNKSGTVTDIVSFFSPENDSYVSLRISVDEISNNASLEEYRNESIKGYLNNSDFHNFILSNNTDRQFLADPVSGLHAYKMVGTYQDPETKATQKVLEVGTITGGNLAYFIQYFADPVKYSYYLPMIQRMIDSFQIDNIGAETQVVPKQKSTINYTTNHLPEGQSSTEVGQPPNTEPNQTYSFKEPSTVYYEGLIGGISAIIPSFGRIYHNLVRLWYHKTIVRSHPKGK